MLAWTFGDERRTQIATRDRAGRYVATRDVAGELIDVKAYGETRTVLLRSKDASGGRTRLGVSIGRTDGDIDPLEALDTYGKGGEAALDVNADGQIAVAYVERVGGEDRLWLATRAPGRSFGDPRVIRGGGQMSDVVVAQGEGGDLVVAYRRGERLEARAQRDGHSLGDVQNLGPAGSDSQIAAATAPSGRMVVAWRHHDTPGASSDVVAVVRAAVRPAGPRSFRDDVVLGDDATLVPAGSGPYGPVAIDMTQDATATVAFTQPERQGPMIRVATTDARARFGDAQALAAGGTVDDLAVSDTATLIVSTRPPSSAGQGIGALIRPAGGTFGSPELVSPREGTSDAAIGVSPDGPPTVVWVARTANGGDTLHAATRAR